MKAIKNLIKAQQNLLKAQENIPSGLKKAAERLSEKTGVDYFEALTLIGDAVSGEKVVKAPTRQVKKDGRKGRKMSQEERNWRSKKAKEIEGFGGSVRPTGLQDIKRRIAKATKEDKKHCYMAAYQLMKAKGEWMAVKDLKNEGIITKYLRNKHRLSACLPTGFIVQTGSRGYRVRDLSKELA